MERSIHRRTLSDMISVKKTASYYENGEKIQTEEMFTDKKGICVPRNFHMENMCALKALFQKM